MCLSRIRICRDELARTAIRALSRNGGTQHALLDCAGRREERCQGRPLVHHVHNGPLRHLAAGPVLRSVLEGFPIAVLTAQDQNRPVAEDVSTLIEQERGALADFLETLTRDEWLSASLCSEWTVQEVAAHVSFAPTVRLRTILVALARDGFRANRTSARLSREWAAQRGPEAIVAGLRDPDSINNPTPGTRLVDVLADTITHHLDVRVPLDRERPAPVEATGIALTSYTRQGLPLSLAFGRNPKATAKGLRLVAEDIGWSHGEGPAVTASSSALVRALTGRSVRRSELSGAGAELLFGRLDR